ncbi:hypothetical protein CJF42_08720 [Pseudoalteromonas sp. NBT06-2]|uniref:acyl carrier protein n=1 Tax=Pseudoalteromonas sp. NBT06-2 TaxID=2025950 RepID=UPI000BA60F8B|nr:acyl carrier protein [Pseudoalteromonas sp. NBT06-2]PAJ74755.1 hypothetical protein CJF42_08720 [Pseudoalteromonas sp. NBT06-2]
MSSVMILEQILNFIVDTYMVEIDEIPLNESLIDEGIIDSFGLIELASFLEKAFLIQVNDDDLTRDNFSSINKMIALVDRKKSHD